MTRRRSTSSRDDLPLGADIVVVGAGMVGCALAAQLASAGADVLVVDRDDPDARWGEGAVGNVLVSDRLPGADLAMARRSAALWSELAAECGDRIEYERRDAIVLAKGEHEHEPLLRLAAAQRAAGVDALPLTPDELRALEPGVAPSVAGGVLYSEDAVVQPLAVVQSHVERLEGCGGRLAVGIEVTGAELDQERRLRRLRTRDGSAIVVGSCVVNAAGAWAGQLSERLGARLPIAPRRGHLLLTRPVAPLTTRQISESGCLADIHDTDDEGWSVSAVIETAKTGGMLLGASREFTGFSRVPDPTIISTIAQRAVSLIPGLADVRLQRTTLVFRPTSPDRLPVIGYDPEIGGLLHATGHEGASVSLAEATAEAVTHLVFGSAVGFDIDPFSPKRFGRRGAA